MTTPDPRAMEAQQAPGAGYLETEATTSGGGSRAITIVPSRAAGSFVGEALGASATATLSWEGVRYSVKEKKRGQKEGAKVILDGITGTLVPGDVMCIMGTSGSGKTSMLNVLSGRHLSGDVAGTILLNRKQRNKSFRRSTAYVEQDDVLFPHLTVQETLRYTARLRLPNTMSRAEKIQRADDVIRELGLQECKETRIGSVERRGISGGERKRTAIGVELITNPSILFLDEPTSGLDSYTAYHIMATVRKLSLSGRAVVCSIHQPRQKIFELFDKVLLLTQGKTTYYGPQEHVLGFFQEVGHPCPPGENTADFLLDTTTVDLRNDKVQQETQAVVDLLQHKYSGSAYRKQAVEEALVERRGYTPGREVAGFSKEVWNLAWYAEFSILVSRAWKNVTREPRTTIAALMQSSIMALIVGGIFFEVGKETDQRSVRDRQGVLFFAVLNNSFMALQQCILLFHQEKQVFNRERSAGAYRVSSYFLSKTMADAVTTLTIPILHCTILYFMVYLQTSAECFFFFVLTILTVIITAQSYGMMLSAATPTLQIAQILAPSTVVLLMMFGGFYLSVDSIWVGFKWIEIFSFMQYGFVALCVNEYEGREFSCDQETYCLQNGTAVLDTLGFGGKNKWYELLKCLGLAALFRIIAYMCLRFLHRDKLKLNTD